MVGARFHGAALLLVALAMPCAAATSADDEDAALMKACPGLEAWKQLHAHGKDAAATATAKPSLPGLQAELKRRVAADQRARETFDDGSGAPDPKAVQTLLSVDADNLRWFKQQVADHGFPTVEEVGTDGVGDAFTLVQHADSDPDFQQQMLETMRARLAAGGIKKSEVAMLTDRVLVAQGKPQRYGSQYLRAKDGSFVPKPTEDAGHVDERRRQMDLMPLADYECVLRESYKSD